MRRGPTPFPFENMWLKEERFKKLLKSWWQGFNFSGSFSFILTAKLKALKTNMKTGTRKCLGRLRLKRAWLFVFHLLFVVAFWRLLSTYML